MQKRLRWICLLLAATLALSGIGVTLAFMFRRAEQSSSLKAAAVSCELSEEFNGSVKSNIRVKNTGNIPAFIRIRVVSYWVKEDGSVVGYPAEYPTLALLNGWLKSSSDEVYYYPTPVAPGQQTEVLCQPFALSTTANGERDTLYQVVTLLAEAIQASPDNAAESAWGITVESGTITDTP